MSGYVLGILNQQLVKTLPIDVQRMPSFYPSSASCIDERDGVTVHGACLRAQWYRCMQYEESNPSGLYSQYIFAAGNLLEGLLTAKLKEAGVWIANSVKFSIPERYISGELDILIRDHDGTVAIVENKSYGAHNYNAKKEICGSSSTDPRPKMQNLIQAFLYQHTLQDQVSRTYLTYLDRSCSAPDNNKEFEITVHVDPKTKRSHPLIKTTNYYGSPLEYVEKSISIEGIFARFDSLMEHLQEQQIPVGDFKHSLTADEIEEGFATGEIAKYKYEAYHKSPDKNPIGDWNCSYCSYRDTCLAQKKQDGHR